MQPIRNSLEDLPSWGKIYKWYLWLSVAICLLLAISVAMLFDGEDAKLISAVFLLIAATGAAFARALRHIDALPFFEGAS